ncbi:LEF-3 [Mocis latipes granulovirus]|uniref:LEF-3 n=1 Tax=Mocis latipes granulovirus TaxID=2072024 RepID=A0A162GX21_9BBAC|nr:LEF-3 [Mocis latipes granulovirus]AKR17529.1 LEF-3 [Mocis latipes granulovirus]
MAKRASESICMDVAKIARLENVFYEKVISKSCWRMNNKEYYRIVANHNNKSLDRSVLDKNIYEEINVNSTYKFTYQKINRLFYIVAYELVETSKNDDLYLSVTTDDFENEKQMRLYVYIVCAYEACDYGNNTFSTIKVCTIIKKDDQFVQCDLIINLTNLTTFDIELHDDNKTRVTKALKRLYQLQNEWCVVSVSCLKTIVYNNVYYKMLLQPETKIEDSEHDGEIHADKPTNDYPNISYQQKIFSCYEVSSLKCELSDYVNKNTQKVNKFFKITIETPGVEKPIKIETTAFINNAKQEESKIGLQAVDMNIANNEKVFAVVHNKPGSSNNCLVSVLTYSEKENDFYSLYC